MTVAFDDLSKHQQRALIDMVTRGGLCRIEAGWDGTHIHRHRTILSLERHGLCAFGRHPGTVDPTSAGQTLIFRMVAETNAAIRKSESTR
jgi:hypothetical protein